MAKEYNIYIFEDDVPVVVTMTLKELVQFIKIFGDRFKIVATEV